MKHLRPFLVFVVFIGCAMAPASGVETVTIDTLLHEMTNRDSLARWPAPAYRCNQVSSYDRASVSPDQPGWFANKDFSNYLRVEDHEGRKEYVMMDADGPGAIVAFFKATTDPLADVRIYLDGSPTPAIQENLRYLLGGASETDQEHRFHDKRIPPFPANEKTFLGGFGTLPFPLAGVQSLGCNFYLPIPFSKHCKVTYDRSGRCFYRINYRTYSPRVLVKTFTLPDLKAAASIIRQTGQSLLDPDQGASVSNQIPAQTRTLPAGGAFPIALNNGPAALRRVSLKLKAADIPQALRSTVLRITFDGEQTVWCPVGDFFCSGIGIHAHNSWDTKVEKDGTMRSFWVMPYGKTCKIELMNLGQQPVEATFVNIAGGPRIWDARSMHFHAGWREQYPIQTKKEGGTMDWNYTDIMGQGVYVGDTLVIHNGGKRWWGEGDEKVYIDNELFPSHFGTGTEDYYGYSLGGRNSMFFEAPFVAHPQIEGDKRPGYSAMTRLRGLDAIPFSRRLKFDMEIWHWEAVAMDYAATTYWYSLPGAASNHPPDPGEASRAILKDAGALQ